MNSHRRTKRTIPIDTSTGRGPAPTAGMVCRHEPGSQALREARQRCDPRGVYVEVVGVCRHCGLTVRFAGRLE